jgi:hypothetical protein
VEIVCLEYISLGDYFCLEQSIMGLHSLCRRSKIEEHITQWHDSEREMLQLLIMGNWKV